MDRKGGKNPKSRCDRVKKRKFTGNRFTYKKDSSSTCTAAKKLRNTGDQTYCIDETHGYCILNFISVFSAISSFIVCKECRSEVNFSTSSLSGLGFKIVLRCTCGVKYINSSPLIGHAYEINRRIVLAMRILGVGLKGINIFCGLMDLGKGLSNSTFYGCMKTIYESSKEVFQLVTKRSLQEEKSANVMNGNPENELTVSGDGTWKKRGFSSLFGVSTLIGLYSKKVIDVQIKSSFCQACNLWKSKTDTEEYENWLMDHEESCTANHSGSAGKMEVDAIKEMFNRSLEKFGVKYTTYIGDGDSKTFKAILDSNPYGEDTIVHKKECVGHVEKRMGSRLRNLKKKRKGLGGKGPGKLTMKVINDLTTYYGLAIRRNAYSLEDMRNAIWATFYHMSSSDTKPQHHLCPAGADSWCKWRRAEAESSLETFQHTTPPLSEDVLEAIKPIYSDLSSEDLLQRCLGAFNQNNNESLNSLIWTFAPKHLHSGPKSIEIATYLACCIFNEGFKPILQILHLMGIKIGPVTETFVTTRDDERLRRAEVRASTSSQEARVTRRSERVAQNDYYAEEEGPLYGPGLAD